jgi:hypothetical protein
MTTLEENKDQQIIGTCGCGKPLYPVLNENGERIGVTHTGEDEDYHFEYFSSIRVLDQNMN